MLEGRQIRVSHNSRNAQRAAPAPQTTRIHPATRIPVLDDLSICTATNRRRNPLEPAIIAILRRLFRSSDFSRAWFLIGVSLPLWWRH